MDNKYLFFDTETTGLQKKNNTSNVTEIEDISDFTNGMKAYYYIFKK
jgi:uncharacterized protein YprB with RNaseH-like and TPR domain